VSTTQTPFHIHTLTFPRDSLAALSLSTDAPRDEILDRPPTPRSASIISITMWKMIIGQAIYQVIVTFILHFAGPQFLNYPEAEMRALIFNMFVWLQIFNQYNNRRLDNKLNIFAGILQNYWFIAMNVIMVGAQVCIVYFGGRAFNIVPLSGEQWAISVVVAIFCVPWAVCIRCFPDRWFEVGAKFFGRPFVVVYRPVARFTTRVGQKMSRKKKVDEKAESGSDADGSSYMGRGKSPVQTIRVSGDLEKKGIM